MSVCAQVSRTCCSWLHTIRIQCTATWNNLFIFKLKRWKNSLSKIDWLWAAIYELWIELLCTFAPLLFPLINMSIEVRLCKDDWSCKSLSSLVIDYWREWFERCVSRLKRIIHEASKIKAWVSFLIKVRASSLFVSSSLLQVSSRFDPKTE